MGALDSLTTLTLEESRRGFDKVLSAASTLQPSTLADEDNPHLWQKQVFDAAQGIIGEFEEQSLKSNSNLASTPLYFYT
jgi:hypothetical protein